VPLSPTYSFGVLRTTGVTLTGKNTFPISGPGSQGLMGELQCEYTVKIRPSNGAGD
jgi:hypothetical protein